MSFTKRARLVSAALLSIACVPVTATVASAQETRTSPVERYHLVQVVAERGEIDRATFERRVAGIGSCEDAARLAGDFDLDIRRNRFVSASSLPPTVRNSLDNLSAGEPTALFGDGDGGMTVFVLCHRA